MTSGDGSVLATRHLAVGGKPVHVTIGRPHPDPAADDREFTCHIAIEGMTVAPIRLRSNAGTPARTVAVGIRKTAERLSVSVAELLSDAQVGVGPYGRRPPPDVSLGRSSSR
ncbi:hypothetical protein [Nocardia sp. BMG51109]|uniref:hypothetical protein n=1 Tax=Nocardia sp. BMG51109 TaxID=1056816 RepID=UPI0004661398|nr:hypothetical protein [Nocardia sp. BMG51109]